MDRNAFRKAVEARSLDDMVAVFAEDAVLHSPVTFKPFEGRAAIGQLLGILLEVFEDFRYTDQLEADDGTLGLVFRARVGDLDVQGLDLIRFDDGDSIDIDWPKGVEHVRILGIDTPEVQHLDHDLPYPQPFGTEAAGFLRGCLAVAKKVELLRSGKKDRYERTLGYVFVNGRNYSVLVIEARLAYGPSDRFGDNGLPEEFASCKAAAARAGPVAFDDALGHMLDAFRVSEGGAAELLDDEGHRSQIVEAGGSSARFTRRERRLLARPRSGARRGHACNSGSPARDRWAG